LYAYNNATIAAHSNQKERKKTYVYPAKVGFGKIQVLDSEGATSERSIKKEFW